MDLQALGDDLSKSLRLLPRPLVEKLINAVSEYQRELGTAFPSIMGTILPHVMAAMPEHAMGILDMTNITAVLGAVLADYLSIKEHQAQVSATMATTDVDGVKFDGRGAADSQNVTPVDVGQNVRR